MVTEAMTGIVRAELALEPFDGEQPGLEAAGIECGLEQQDIGAALDQRFGLLVIASRNALEGDRARDVDVFGGRPHGAGDEARLGGGGEFVGGLAGETGRGEIQLVARGLPGETQPETISVPPNVLVSMISAPASRYAR